MSDPAAVPEKLLYDPGSSEFRQDPYPSYHLLRETDPLHESPLGFRVATRYEDVAFILRDKRFIQVYDEYLARMGSDPNEPIYKFLGETLVLVNPPHHTRLRNPMVKVFTARRIEEMRPRIQSIVDAMLDDIVDQGNMDVIADYAFPLPFTVVCEMLGVPEDDRNILMKRSFFFPALSTPCRCSMRRSRTQTKISNWCRIIFSACVRKGVKTRPMT